MGLQAKSDFPDLDLDNATMVGDTIGDMQFGRNLGVKTVYLSNRKALPEGVESLADQIFMDMADFAMHII